MTKDKKAKAAARQRQAETGEPYTLARRRTLQLAAASAPRTLVDDHCANCLQPLPDDVRGLFCGTWCKETASLVRYWRGTIRDGRLERDPLVGNAIRTQLAFLLVGGYGALRRRLPGNVRLEVRLRDDDRCQSCGKPGEEIDHINGSSPDLDNLQLLCGECHRTKTAKNMRPAGKEEVELIRALFELRVVPDEPRLLADDESAWQHVWRGLEKDRKERFRDRLLAMGVEVAKLKTRRQMLEELSYFLDAYEMEEPVWTEDFDGGFGPDSYFARSMQRDD
jgi:5-methylcytosine-specific restriction endonuclease McrA